MKKLILLSFFIATHIAINCQNQKIDSLKKVLNSSNSDAIKLDLLQEISGYYIRNRVKEGKPYFLELLNLSEKLKESKITSRANNYISEFFMVNNKKDSAIYYAKNAVKISKDKLLYSSLFISYNQLGRAYHHFQEFNDAIKAYEEGIRVYKTNPKGSAIVQLLSNKSIAQSLIGDTENQISTLLESIKYADSLGNYTSKAFALYNAGMAHMKLENFKKAKEYFLIALKDSQQIKLKPYITMQFNGLAQTFSKWGKYKEAERYYFKTLNAYKKMGNQLYVFDTYNNIAVLYIRKKQFEKALYYSKESIAIIEEIGNKKYTYAAKQTLIEIYIKQKKYMEALSVINSILEDKNAEKLMDELSLIAMNENLATINFELGNHKKSNNYYKRVITLKDSLNKKEKRNKFQELEKKYQTEKKEKQLAQQKIAIQEQELLTQKANTRNWILGLGLLAISISAYFIWRRYKLEAEAKYIISEQKTQIEKLQKEFHHRIKNDFRSINSYIGLVQRQFTDTQFKESLSELKNRVTSMFKVHEILLRENDITKLKAQPYLLELSQNVSDKFNNANIKVSCNVGATETIVADKAIPFGVVLNEFVTNSYKYAFDEKGGEIKISFTSDINNHQLTLKDNGKGLPDDFNIENLRSLGMSIIPMFADLHDGSYQLDGTNGVSLTLTLPKKCA